MDRLVALPVPLDGQGPTVWAGNVLLAEFDVVAGWKMITEPGPEQGDLVIYNRLTGSLIRRFKRGSWSKAQWGL